MVVLLKRGNGAAKDAGRSSRAGVSCNTNSFDGSTTVLMADGSWKPIRDVKSGDRVIATDPLTGETAVKVVSEQRVHESERSLYEISVLTLKGVGKITATDEHPFWVSSLHEWKHAEDLKPGYRFTTADNRPATVLGTRSFSKVQLVYNLTVDGTHTYYVGAAGRGQTAAADVLVHNCEEARFAVDSSGEVLDNRPDARFAVDSSGVVTDSAGGGTPTSITLGRNPGYVRLASVSNSYLFGIDNDGWLEMYNRKDKFAGADSVTGERNKKSEVWLRNAAFLNHAIASGHDVLLGADPTLSRNIGRAGGYFAWEIQHMMSKGYTVSPGRLSMQPPAQRAIGRGR